MVQNVAFFSTFEFSQPEYISLLPAIKSINPNCNTNIGQCSLQKFAISTNYVEINIQLPLFSYKWALEAISEAKPHSRNA